MEERIQALTPSILIIASIAISTYAYLLVVGKRLASKLQSVDSIKKDRLRLSLLVGWPAVWILAPALEELVFRAPLLIAFGRINNEAWYGILTSAVLFGAIHWRGDKLPYSDILEYREMHPDGTDNPDEIIAEISTQKRTPLLVRKMIHVTIASGLGAVIGYYGIKHQSLWLCVGLHAIWNFAMTTVLVVAIGFITLLMSTIILLGDSLYRSLVGIYKRRTSAARRRKYHS